jgi:hypothetical protein
MAEIGGTCDPRAHLKALIDRHEMIRGYNIKQNIEVFLEGPPIVTTVITIDAILTDAILPEENTCQK